MGGSDFPEIANERYRLRVDPARGGAVVSLTDDGRELLADGQVGNDLAVYDEYPAHPDAGEGPWHLLPKGPVVVSSSVAAESVECYRSRWGSAWWCTGGLVRCCATPRR